MKLLPDINGDDHKNLEKLSELLGKYSLYSDIENSNPIDMISQSL